MDSLFFLIVSLALFLLSFFLQKLNSIRLHLPPGPKGLPFFGNLFQLDNSTLHLYFWKLSQMYGPLMSLRIGSRPVLVVSSAEMAKQVMKTYDSIFCDRPSFLGQQRLSYNGLDLGFCPYGAYWREMKRISKIHLFNPNKVQTFRPIRESEVSAMLERISELASASKPVNLSSAVKSLTSAITCRVGLGKRYNQKEIENSRFHELVAETEDLLATFFISDHFPVFGFLDRLTGSIRRLEKNFQDFDSFYEQIINEHLSPNRPKPEHEDIVDALLQVMKDDSFKIQVTFNHIKAILMNVFVAGTDTSAACVVWAMTFLMKNKMAMEKAQREVRKVCGNKGFVDEDDIQQLLYLKAVVKEAMRLQPPGPLLLPRESSENCKLEGFDIPKKTIVYVNAYAIGRDSQVWENPEEFCPERFIGNSIDLKGQDFGLIPFGAGRRMCPGMHSGLANVELALANLLYKFDWRMPDGMESEDLDMEAEPGITMHKKNALCLMATAYEPTE